MRLLCLSSFFWRVAALNIALLAVPAVADVADDDIRFAWGVRTFGDRVVDPATVPPITVDVIPTPWYHPVNTWVEDLATMKKEESDGIPVSAFLRNNTSPVYMNPLVPRPGALDDLLEKINSGSATTPSYIRYILVDYEKEVVKRENGDIDTYSQADADQALIDTVAAVRNHPNPLINRAWIGDFDESPESDLGGTPWGPAVNKRSARALFYKASGVNVAQPDLYPYSFYHMHHDDTPADGLENASLPLSPNVRSGMFYGPLERFSVAMKALPSDHFMIPNINGYGVTNDPIHNDDEGPPPEKEDLGALLQHLRLRGSTGYATFTVAFWQNPQRKKRIVTDALGNETTIERDRFYRHQEGDITPVLSWIDTYTNEEYRLDMVSAWDELDPLFKTPGRTVILNLDTVKATGVEWSGVKRGNQVGILVTNLGDVSATVDLPDIPGLPNFTGEVAAGSHKYFEYTIDGGKGVLGNYIWEDLNDDGVQQKHREPGLANVTVELLNCQHDVLETTTSDATGHYAFDRVEPDNSYMMRFHLPTDPVFSDSYTFSREKQGSDYRLDSNVNPATGLSLCYTMQEDQRRTAIDVGMVPSDTVVVDSLTFDKAVYYSSDNRVWIRASSDAQPAGSSSITATATVNGNEVALGTLVWKESKGYYQRVFIDIVNAAPTSVTLTNDQGTVFTGAVEVR